MNTRGAQVTTGDDGAERVLKVVIQYRVDERINTRRQVAEPRKRDKHRLGNVTVAGAGAVGRARTAAVSGDCRCGKDRQD